MNELQENDLKARIAKKLHPSRFPNVSGKMFAVLGSLLNVRWTSPALASITATSDGALLGRPVGSIGFDEFLGDFSDLRRNALEMAAYAGDLTEEEMTFLSALLDRVEAGQETSSGDTATDLSLDALGGSTN